MIKRALIAVSIAAAISGPVHGGGIPVIDTAAIQQAVIQVNHALTQIETLRQQLAQAQALYQSVTGIRNLGDALSNPHIRAALPADLQGALDGVQSAGQVVDRARAILTDQRLPESLDDAERYLRQRQAELAAAQQALAEGSYGEVGGRLNRLDALLLEVNRASDLQMTAALQARLAAEQATLAAENHRLLAAMMASQAAARLAEQQRSELARRTWEGTGKPLPDFRDWGGLQ